MWQVACVDDEPLFRAALARGLKSDQIAVHRLASVRDFLESDALHDFDLVLADLAMPDAKGMMWDYSGLQIIKDTRRYFGESIPIWVISGNDDSYVERAVMTNGADRFLSKAAGVETVCEEVRAYFAQRSAPAAPRKPDASVPADSDLPEQFQRLNDLVVTLSLENADLRRRLEELERTAQSGRRAPSLRGRDPAPSDDARPTV